MTTHDLWLLPLAISVGLGLFLSLALLAPPTGRRPANFLLGVLCLLVSATLVEHSLLWTGGLTRIPHGTAVTYGVPFLVGPLLLLHGRALDPSFRWRPYHLVHAVPFALLVAWQVPFFAQSAEAKTVFVETQLLGGDYFLSPTHLGIVGAQLGLAGVYLVSMVRSRPPFEPQGAEPTNAWTYDRICAAWLRRSHQLYAGYLTAFALYLSTLLTGRYYAWLCLALAIVMTTHLLTIALWAVRRPEVLHGVLRTPQPAQYATSGLRADTLETYIARLRRLMEEEQLYLEPGLRLADLARHARIAPHHVSQALNQRLGVNYAGFVNGYRIDRAKSLLRQRPGATALEIAHEVGFNSKNAFQAAFVRHCGVSPSSFRQRLSGEIS